MVGVGIVLSVFDGLVFPFGKEIVGFNDCCPFA